MVIKSKRSGGPKTAAGKLVASRNAIKAGTYANITVLPGEDLKQFEELEEQFFNDFAPSGLAESAMVRELTALTWKKLRLERLEHRALLQIMAPDVSFAEVQKQFDGTVRLSAESAYLQIDKAGPAWIRQGNSLKKFALRMKAADLDALDLDQIKRESADFYSVLTRCAKEFDVADLMTAIVSKRLTTSDLRSVTFWDYAIGKAVVQADDILWVTENKGKLLAAIRDIKDQRLMVFMLGDRIRRAHDDLSRAFFKVLSELRKHQVWIRSRPIDITSTPSLTSS